MSKSVNKVTLLGNVGVDPEVRTTQNGFKNASFTLATSQQWNDARGDKQEKTQWHRLICWDRANGGVASIAERYVRKGTKLYVEGEIEYRQYQDRDGQTKYITEIKVIQLVLLGGKDDSDPSAGEQSRRVAGPPKRQPARPAASNDDDFDDFPGALQDEDDDLPF
ncbi:MAG: single-stranded DNA-binding protein [Gemmatimonas sp.]